MKDDGCTVGAQQAGRGDIKYNNGQTMMDALVRMQGGMDEW